MIEIPLTQGKVALIDDEDYELVSRYKWCAHRNRKTFYARRGIRLSDGRKASVSMHRLILGLIGRAEQVDHANGDGLDNRRANLRVATHAQNAQNRGMRADNSSTYKGVTAVRGKWKSYIWLYGKQRHLGVFDTAQRAARAYDEAAIKAYGAYARLNFPHDGGQA